MSGAGNKPCLSALLLFVVFGFAEFATAQQAPPLSVKPIRGGVYYTDGGVGSDTGIIVGKDGVIVVDAKMTEDSVLLPRREAA